MKTQTKWGIGIGVVVIVLAVVFGAPQLYKGQLIPRPIPIPIPVAASTCSSQWTEIFTLAGSPIGAPAVLSGNFNNVVNAVKNGCDVKVVAVAPEAQTISFECKHAEIFHELPADAYKGFRCYQAGHVESDSLNGIVRETLQSINFEYAKNIPGERITYSISNYYGDGADHTVPFDTNRTFKIYSRR